MAINSVKKSSKSELSSRGKHAFKVYIYSLKLLAKSTGIPNAHAGNVVANFSVSQLLGYTVNPRYRLKKLSRKNIFTGVLLVLRYRLKILFYGTD